MSKKFVYDLGFKVDKRGLDEAIAALRQVQAAATEHQNSNKITDEMKAASASATQLIDILSKSWNDKLGQLNLSTVNKEIKNTWKSVSNLQQSLLSVGTSGQLAFDKVATQILHTNLQMRNSSKILDEMGQSFANTIKWGISSSVFNSLTGALGKAYGYAKNLDSSLNDIRVVTGQSASSMEKFAMNANKAAKELGASTLDYTEAALIYYQQGLSDEEVAARTDVTLKAANVTGQSGAEVSEQLTAVWNGYNLANKAAKEGMGIYEEYVDKLAAVAATTASDLEEISTGMSKVASAANLMGVDIDQLNAQLATIVSVTRQAPESVGTALKTIYARMGDIEAGLDAETTLGTYTSEMADMGFNVLDASGKLRDMGDVIEEIGGKWTSMSREQQIALAQTMAGTRQYNNLLSLFDSWDMYESALKTSQEALGTLDHQQAIYMESTEAHLAALSTAFEKTYDVLFDEEEFNGLVSGLTEVVEMFNIFLESLGGGMKTLGAFGALAGNVLSKQLGKGLEELLVENWEGWQSNKAQEQLYEQILKQYGYLGVDSSKINTVAAEDPALAKELEYAEKIFKLRGFITEEEAKELSQLQEKIGALEYELDAIKTYKQEIKTFSEEVSQSNDKYADLDATSDITRWEQARKESSKDLGVAVKEEKLYEKHKDSFKNLDTMKKFKESDENAYNFLMGGAIGDAVGQELERKQAQVEALTQELTELMEELYDAQQEQETLDLEEKKLPKGAKKEKEKYTDKYLKALEKESKTKEKIAAIEIKLNKKRDEGLLEEEELEFVTKRYAENKEKALKTQQKIKKIVEGMRQEEKTSEGDLEAEQEQAERELQFKLQQEERQKLYAQGVQAISATIQGIYTLSSVFDILLDKETTVVQKIGALVPLGLSIAMTFGQTANLITSLNANMAAGIAKRSALKTVEAAAQAAYNQELTKEKVIEAASVAAKKANLKLSQEEITTLLTRQGLIKANTAATTGDIAVKTADIGVTAALKAVQDKLNASMMKFPLMWILGAIATVTAIVMGLVTAQQKRREEEYKLRQEQIEKLNETQEEIDKNLELVKSYEEIYKQYKSGKTSKQELEEATDSLNGVLEEEDLKIAKLTGNYEELIKKIDEYKKKKLEEGRDSAEEEVDKTGAQITSKAIEGQGHRESNNTKYSIDFDGWSVGKNEEKKAWDALYSKAGDYYRSGADDMLGSAFVVETDYDAESIVKLYDALVAARQEMYDTMTSGELSASGIYKQVDEWIGKMQKDVEAYKKAIEDVANYSAELSALNYNFDEITDFTKFKAERDKFIEDLKKLEAFKEKSQEEIEAIADAYISKTSDTSGEFLNKIAAVDQLAERFGESYRSAIEKAYDGLSSGELAALLDESNTKLKEQFEAMVRDGVPAAEALRMLGKEYKNAALDSLLLSKGIKDQLEELDYSEEAYVEFVDQLRKENKVLDENISLAKEMALVNIRMNKGLADLGENFKDLKLVLRDNKRNTSEFAAALEQMQGIMKNILNLESGDLLSDDFYTSAANLKLMEQAANGNLDAIEKLRQAAGNDILAQVKVNVDDESVLKAISDLDNFIDNYPVKDLEVGAQLQDAEFINKLNKLVEDSKMTTEQVQAYLNSMGYDPEITETKPVKQKTTHWGSYPEPIYDSDGSIKEIKAHPYKWESEDEIQVPIIKSVTYNKPDKKTINFSNTSAGKAAKASGGSKSKPKKEEKIENNKDRYHDIEVDLKKVANEMQKVEDAQDKLVGQDLINNLQKQYNLLNKEIDLTAQKIGIAKEEQDELKAKLASKGVMFNSDGTIANYAQAYDKQLAYVNSIIDKYNAMDAKGQEAYQETLDKAMDDWEKFLDNIDSYDDLITDKIPGLEADIRKALDQQIEIKLEAFEYEIEIRLDMSEAERDWNAFKTRIIDGIKEDDILGNAKSKLKDFSTYYNAQGTGEIDATATHVNKILQQLHQMDADQAAGVYGEKYSYTNAQGELVTIDYNNRKQALEDLKEYYTQLMDSMTNLQDLSEEIHQSYLDMMDETQEKFDEQLNTYERLNDMINHDMDLTTLIFGEESYSMLTEFYKKQKENSLEQLDFQRQQVDFWRSQMDAAEEGSERWENAKEKWEEAIDSWKDGTEKAIQDTIDEYTNAVGAIFEDLNNKVTGGVGLTYASKEWELINKEADRYLDSINAIYETQTLQNKYLDAIEKSANPAMQQKINNIMEDELALLREKDKLSEYDIERANLRYEIAMKQLALEESQQKKTQLRLRRDSQGNYRYQYTEDENEVSKIKQELSDLYNQLYNLDTGQYKSNLDELYNIWEEFNQEMFEASKINDPEEKARTELLIKEKYGSMINDIVADNEFIQKNLHESTLSELFDLYGQNTANYEQMTADQQEILDWFLNSEMKGLSESAFNNLFGLYDDNVNAFKTMTDEEIRELTGSFVPQFNTTFQTMADVIKGEGGFVPTCKEAFDALNELGKTYLAELTKLYDEYIKKSEAVQGETKDLVKDNTALIKAYQDQLDQIQVVIDELEKLEKAYAAAAESAKKAATEAKEYWTAAQNQNANVDSNIKDTAPKPTKTEQPKETVTKPQAEQKQSLALNSYVKVKSGQTWYEASDGSGRTGTARSGTIVRINSGSKYPYNIDWLGWVKKEAIEGYDTGGYTGEWNNSDGKLAMLHQKELVLNANDTKNILNAVEILRGITNNLGQALMNQMASISATGATAIAGAIDSESLEQNVHIDAQFPNVKDSREIETALNNLVNMASQHIQKN